MSVAIAEAGTAGFELGRVLVTQGALTALQELTGGDAGKTYETIRSLLHRHQAGDWGDVDLEDVGRNEEALEDGSRLLSVYRVEGQRFWVITDAETDVCPACWAGIGRCEPERGERSGGFHFRTDLPRRRLSTTILRPEDY
jgi:hypothetical protein